MTQVSLRFSDEQIEELDALAKARQLKRATYVQGIVEASLNDQREIDQIKHRLAELERKLEVSHEESKAFHAAILLAVAGLSSDVSSEKVTPGLAKKWLASKGIEPAKRQESES